MGVYVKGMGIPKNCYHCPMHDHDDTGIMCVYLGRLTENRPIDCPLIEIDDELFKKAESAYVLQQIRRR